MTVAVELTKLREAMKLQNVEAVIIPTSDFHDTEYVADYFAARVHFSGFTGSAGTLVVLMDGGALWTDGRYYIQAARELKGSGLVLMKQGMPGTLSIPEYLTEHLKSGDTVAVDGRCISEATLEEYRGELEKKGIEIRVDLDLPGQAWTDRPAMPAAPVWNFDEKYSGESTSSKLERLRSRMKDLGAENHVINKIDETAWLFNIRAHDIPSFPAPLSYALITPEKGFLYINQERVPAEVREKLESQGVEIRDYEAVYEDLKSIEEPVLMEKDLINSRIASLVKEPVWGDDPVILMKAAKNETEQEGFRKAHHKDAAAVIRFWHWLENEMKQAEVTEISALEKLHEFRAEQPGFVEDSFSTISAYGENAAMPHYHPNTENPVKLQPKGFYLVDSGGHYLDGTTDITRTFVMGDLSDEEKKYFTKVLQGHIALSKAVFKKGVRGLNLDILARGPLWDEGKDFNHGTGHGVGHLLSVHEAPNGFRWQIVPERNDSCVFEAGMVTSDEPGFYEEGKFGIRHENLLMTQDAGSTEFGDFLCHEVLTLVPFDVRGLDLDMMKPDEIQWLNDYHQRIFTEISPMLSEEEATWLKEKTAPVGC